MKRGLMSDDELDMGTTGLAGGTGGANFSRFQNIGKLDATTLRAISRAEKIRVSRSGPYLIFGLGNPVSFLSIACARRAIASRTCNAAKGKSRCGRRLLNKVDDRGRPSGDCNGFNNVDISDIQIIVDSFIKNSNA